MQAVHIKNPGDNSSLSIEQTPSPQPKDNEVLVKIKATAVNRADLHQRSGNYPPPEGASEILGLEMAGIVEETGSKVQQWKQGDRIYALLPGGGYAEYCVIPAKMGIAIPGNMSFEQAAAIPETFLTAYQALKWIGRLQRAETVLIHAGASGVGTAAIQLSHHLMNARIITTASQKSKLDKCKELGADYAINYKEQDFAEEIERATGKNSVDLIIDFIGAPYWENNIKILNTDGRIVYLSFLGGPKLEQVSLAPLLKKRLTVTGSTLRNRTIAYKINLTNEFSKHTRDLFSSERLNPVIDKLYDWSNTEAAHQYMNQNKNTGKIVLTGM